MHDDVEAASDPGDGPVLPEVSVVMPIRDRGGELGSVLREASDALSRVARDWELLIVDDGSTDETVEVAREAARDEPRIRVLVQPGTFGRGAALRRGFDAARCLVVVALAPEMVGRLGAAGDLFTGLRDAELVTVRRPLPAALVTRFRWWLFGWLQRRMLGVMARDATSPLKMMRGSLLRMVSLESDGESVELELLARTEAAGLRWTEIVMPELAPRPARPPFALLWKLRKSL